MPINLNSYYSNNDIKYVKIDDDLSVAILEGIRPAYTANYESGAVLSYEASNTDLLIDPNANVLVVKKVPEDDGLGNQTSANDDIIAVTVDYSYYMNNIMNAIVSLTEYMNPASNAENVGTSIVGMNAEMKTYNERRRITRLILDYTPYTPSTSTTQNEETGRTTKVDNIAEKIFIESEIINGANAQGICISSSPVDYKRLLKTTETYRTNNDNDDYNLTEDFYEEPYFIIDLVSASGEFVIGETVTGNLSGYNTTIRDIVIIDGQANYSIGNMSGGNVSGESPLTRNQQRALIMSALKNSGTLNDLIAEIQNPTNLPF